jgi:GrpB-like predicted nucleotidyltransferase (UPF0157 family)
MNEEELRAAWVTEPPKLTGKLQVVDWDPAWPGLFRRDAERIRVVLGERVVQLEHVGSTSVPGLAAKPVIDILLVVPDSSDEPAYLPLHVYSPGCPEIERYLVFRDRLRSHPEDRAHYQRVKRELAERDWTSVQEYADARTEVVEAIVAPGPRGRGRRLSGLPQASPARSQLLHRVTAASGTSATTSSTRRMQCEGPWSSGRRSSPSWP